MSWAIPEVKNTIAAIVAKFKSLSEKLKFAIVGYKDHPPQDPTYVYKIISNF